MRRDQISYNTLYTRFYGKRNKGRPRLGWMNNIEENMASLGLTLTGPMNLTNYLFFTMIMMMMMMMMTTTMMMVVLVVIDVKKLTPRIKTVKNALFMKKIKNVKKRRITKYCRQINKISQTKWKIPQ